MLLQLCLISHTPSFSKFPYVFLQKNSRFQPTSKKQPPQQLNSATNIAMCFPIQRSSTPPFFSNKNIKKKHQQLTAFFNRAEMQKHRMLSKFAYHCHCWVIKLHEHQHPTSPIGRFMGSLGVLKNNGFVPFHTVFEKTTGPFFKKPTKGKVPESWWALHRYKTLQNHI